MMSAVELYTLLTHLWGVIKTWPQASVLNWRRREIRRMDGELFFKFFKWPRYMRRIYFQNAYPHGDVQTFQLILFLTGNGLSFYRAAKWILSSHALVTWERRDRLVQKRIAQMKWIREHYEMRTNQWRYFDIDARRILYINGRVYTEGNN